MKVVIVSSYYPPETKGGAEISAHLLALGLREGGNEVIVITEGKGVAVEIDGILVHKIKAGLRDKPLLERRRSRAIARALERQSHLLETADIIHASDFRAVLGLMEWRRMRAAGQVPIIGTIRDYAPISGSTNFISAQGELPANHKQDAWVSHRIREARGPRRWARWWQYRANIGYRQERFSELDGAVYLSHEQAGLIKKHMPKPARLTAVIQNPVADNYLEKKMGQGYSGNVLYVGTVEYYKGVGLLIDSWREVSRRAPHATLKIVGEGRDRAAYERIIDRTGLRYQVRVSGPVKWDQVIDEYDKAQIVVAPHIWYEPFGRTVAEGMARGKVVVAAEAGGPKEIIKSNVTGLLFARNSTAALTWALLKAINFSQSERMQMGQAAHEWAKQNLDKAQVASLYEGFYKEVIANQAT